MGAHLPRRGRVLGLPATLVMDCQMATGSRSASRSRNSSGCYDELVHPNARLPTTFLSAFGARDHETMAKFCADDATFGDPLFTELDADGVRAMWRMFCTSGNNIEVSFQPCASGRCLRFRQVGDDLCSPRPDDGSQQDRGLVLLPRRSQRSPPRPLRLLPLVPDGSRTGKGTSKPVSPRGAA